MRNLLLGVLGIGFLLAPANAGTQPVALAATGQTEIYVDGDDGSVQAGVAWLDPRFQKQSDGTILDRQTGLMWFPGQVCIGQVGWEAALQKVADLNAGTLTCDGITATHADWRLPNLVELESLLNLSVAYNETWIMAQWGVEMPPAFNAWTSTPAITTTGGESAWVVNLDDASMGGANVLDLASVYPVRLGPGDTPDAGCPCNPWKTGVTVSKKSGDDGDGQRGVAWPDPRFTDHGDGTVTDHLTGLMWLKQMDCLGYEAWSLVFAKITNLNAGIVPVTCTGYTASHDDWRLPNRKEFLTLTDPSQEGYPLPAGHPFVLPDKGQFWTSTTSPQFTDHAFEWRKGAVLASRKGLQFWAWAVRGPVGGPVTPEAVPDAPLPDEPATVEPVPDTPAVVEPMPDAVAPDVGADMAVDPGAPQPDVPSGADIGGGGGSGGGCQAVGRAGNPWWLGAILPVFLWVRFRCRRRVRA